MLPATVELWHGGRCVARHPRSYGRHQEVLDLEHYLDVLERKPGAFAGSKPLAQWRRAGRWPASYDQLWERLVERQGKQAGTKAMVEVVQLGRTHGDVALRVAIEAALALGCHDVAAVRHLLTTDALERARGRPEPLSPLVVGALAHYDRPLPTVTSYDQLLQPPLVPGTAGEAMGVGVAQ